MRPILETRGVDFTNREFAVRASQTPLDAAPRDNSRLATVAAVVLLVAGISLQHRDDGRVGVPGVLPPLPHSCALKHRLGLDCPLCGLTRSVIDTLHGHPATAFGRHPAGPLLVTASLWWLLAGIPAFGVTQIARVRIALWILAFALLLGLASWTPKIIQQLLSLT
jgi:hypothetical protein